MALSGFSKLSKCNDRRSRFSRLVMFHAWFTHVLAEALACFRPQWHSLLYLSLVLRGLGA